MNPYSPLTPAAQRMFNTPGTGSVTDISNVTRNLIAENRPTQQQAAAPAAAATTATVAAPNYAGAAIGALQQSANLLNEREQGYMNRLNAEVASQRLGLEAARTTGTENLERQKETTTRQKNLSLRQLAQNIRGAYQGGMNRLAAGGAADSSAAGMYKFALGQQEAQNRADLLSNYNYNLGNIDIATKQLERDYNTKLQALDQWKTSQAFEIADKFRVARDEINQRLAQYGSGYVSAAQSQLAQQTAQQLANVSAQVGSAQQVIQNDFANAAAQLRDYAQANVNPDVAMQSSGTSAQPLLYANPTLYRKITQ